MVALRGGQWFFFFFLTHTGGLKVAFLLLGLLGLLGKVALILLDHCIFFFMVEDNSLRRRRSKRR